MRFEQLEILFFQMIRLNDSPSSGLLSTENTVQQQFIPNILFILV